MISDRARDIPPFIVMDVMERAQELQRSGRSVVHLEVGEPDFDTPAPVKEEAMRALADGFTHYTSSLGLPELREAICEYYQKEYSVHLTPDRILVTSGTSPAMLLVFSALLNPGDEVIISDPHYACYPNFIRYVGGVPRKVLVREQDGFRFSIDELKAAITEKTKAIMINSPSNPTGNILFEEDLRRIADLGQHVVSDEIYHGLVYEGRAHSILEYTDQAFVINGFSKLYAMTGWRLGYVIVPPGMMRGVQKLQQNLFICAAAFAQKAAVAALTRCDEYVRDMVNTYDKRRRFLIRALRDLGFGITVEPVGAFYVLANAKHLSRDSYRLAFDILEKANVAVTPGIDFGQGAEGYLRFSYANSIENIEEGMRRLKSYLDTFEPGRV
ncbi:MAG: pyridoxal phosphate-dependent aminotransferase [Bacillota bacterium]